MPKAKRTREEDPSRGGGCAGDNGENLEDANSSVIRRSCRERSTIERYVPSSAVNHKKVRTRARPRPRTQTRWPGVTSDR